MKLLAIMWLLFISLPHLYAWQNPMNMTGQKAVGVGDPYIFKFRGIYYLYSSSRDDEIIYWTSKDLVNWSNAAVCCKSADAVNSYAPEVIYWNGKFYLYSSPKGAGHKVFEADYPEGPFKLINGNVGRKIDGSTFIDDDGSFYFYYADGSGILGCPMTSPYAFKDTAINLNAQVGNNWTEAPCVFKRNGIYYLMYTGNHVYSNAYRVNYASNAEGPVSRYTPAEKQNPVLLNTEGSLFGLGHGTAFIGPDLDTYYFTYHNLDRSSGTPYARHFNYDRMAWNGEKLLVLGPTWWAQKNPELATAADWFERTDIGSDWNMPDGGNWSIVSDDVLVQDNVEAEYKAVFTKATADDYTAEFTMKAVDGNSENASLGGIFSYVDAQNYGVALLNGASGQLEVKFMTDGMWGAVQSFNLPDGFDINVWHSIRIEKNRTNYKFFVDGLTRGTLSGSENGGYIGYVSCNGKSHFSYIAISDKVDGSGIFDVYKPIPGYIQAIHYNSGGEGVGHHDLTEENTGDATENYTRHDNVDVSNNVSGGFHLTSVQAGEWYNYNVNVRRKGSYTLGLRYSATEKNTQIKLSCENADLIGAITLPDTKGEWTTHIVEGLQLPVGYKTLKLEILQGEFELYEMQFREGDSTSVTVTDAFDGKFGRDWNYTDGQWSIVDNQANIAGYGKRTIGNSGWSDFTIDCDITYISGMNAGLIFRVNNPALGGEGDDPQMGTDFLQGYFAGITAEGVSLGKHNYNWTKLAAATGSYSTNRTYHLRVVTKGINIKVYVDDMETPKIDYDDPEAFITGKVGFRAHSSHVRFDNLVITVGNGSAPSGVEDIKKNDGATIGLYPNPVKDVLVIRTDEVIEQVQLYSLTGRLLYSQSTDQPIDMQVYPNGMYLLEIETPVRKFNEKIIKETF